MDKIKARVSVFLGIPYAQPPIGEARLMVRIFLRKGSFINYTQELKYSKRPKSERSDFGAF